MTGVPGRDGPETQPLRFAVLGAGSWGTALAMQLTRVGSHVVLWDWDRDHIEAVGRAGRNERFLPDFPLPPELETESDLETAVRGADELLIVVPSHAFAGLLKQIAPWLAPGQGVSWACKGLDPGTGRFLHEPAEALFGRERPLAVVTGPSFAREVAANLPTAITVASNNPMHADRVAGYLHGQNFRAYTSDDLVGVQVGGASKNVMAIAAGISDGLGFGANARAALITRGLYEITRLGLALGGKPDTFVGLTGLGDLALTCTDDQSRNRRMGLALGRGKSVESTMREIGQAVEGVGTAKVVKLLADRCGVEMPICHQVFRVLYESHAAKEAVAELLSRDQRSE